ncbi:MAG: 6-phosphogluconolactonase [Candidatus Paceibacterota bacterium]
MKIIKSKTPAETAGEKLSDMLLAHKDTPTLLLLSGGSALSLLDHVSPEMLGPQLTITTLDERFSTDPSAQNFAQIQATAFYHTAQASGASVIDTTTAEGDTLAAVGDRFEAALRAWKDQHPDGVVIATMGIGADGHTAGILPGDYKAEFSGRSWVAAYEVSPSVNPHTKRITVTQTFLRTAVSEALVYAVGSEKKPIIEKLSREPCPSESMPACVVCEMQSVSLITDVA